MPKQGKSAKKPASRKPAKSSRAPARPAKPHRGAAPKPRSAAGKAPAGKGPSKKSIAASTKSGAKQLAATAAAPKSPPSAKLSRPSEQLPVVVAKTAPPAKGAAAPKATAAPAGKGARGAQKSAAPLAAAAKIAVLKAAVNATKSGKPLPRTLIQTGKPVIRAGEGGVRVVRPQRASVTPAHAEALPPSRSSLSFGARASAIPSTAGKSTKAMNRKSSYKKADLQRYQDLLLEKRESLAGDLRSMESQAFRQSGTESAPNHMADYGSDTFEQDFTLGLIESDEKVLGQIHAALLRIEKGVFGICESCVEDIPKARLDVLPWVSLCVKCQSQAEKS